MIWRWSGWYRWLYIEYGPLEHCANHPVRCRCWDCDKCGYRHTGFCLEVRP